MDGDFKLFESRAIARYLATKYQIEGIPQLMPKDLEQAAHVDQYISMEYSYWDPGYSGYVWKELFKKYHAGIEPDVEKVKEYQDKITQTLDVYEKLLEGKAYLVGDHLTVADIVHLPYGYFYSLASGSPSLEDLSRPNVARWWKNISTQKFWQEAFPHGYLANITGNGSK